MLVVKNEIWAFHIMNFSSAQFSSISRLCSTLYNPMAYSTPGFPVHRQLLKLAQTHFHRVSDAIQSSHPVAFPAPPAFNLSQHQGFFPLSQFFASGDQSIGISLSSISLSNDYSGLIQDRLDWSPCSPKDSWVFSNTTVQKNQLFCAHLSL